MADETAIRKNLFLFFFKKGSEEFRLLPDAAIITGELPFLMTEIFSTREKNLTEFFSHRLAKYFLVERTAVLFVTAFFMADQAF